MADKVEDSQTETPFTFPKKQNAGRKISFQPIEDVNQDSKAGTPNDQNGRRGQRPVLRAQSSIAYYFEEKGSSMAACDCVERPLSVFYYRYGRYVANHPWPFIAIPLIITAIACVGLFFSNKVSNVVYLFTPTGAKSHYEQAVINEHWPLRYDTYLPGRAAVPEREIQVIAMVRDDKNNVLTSPYSNESMALDQFVQNNISVTKDGVTYGYKDLCMGWREDGCPGNPHLSIISSFYQSGFNITYPMMRGGLQNFYLGAGVGGVTVRRVRDVETNETQSYIESARAWFMIYHLKYYPENMSDISIMFEKELQRQLKDYPSSPNIAFTYFHSLTLEEELERNADTLVPRFAIAFTILIIFSILCSFSLIKKSHYVDWVLSKPAIALAGVLNAGMGAITAIGILNLLGHEFYTIVTVMPFLVVAIGVDNMFLLVAGLNHTNRALPVPKRISECLSDAAISITITALTDGLSFGIGAITRIPAVHIFCVYTCVAIVVTFVFQLTFFLGLLVLYTRLERNARHCVALIKTVPAQERGSTSLVNKLLRLGSRYDPDISNTDVNLPDSMATTFFRDIYAPILMHPIVRGLVVFWLIVYLAIAIFGCLHLRLGLEPVNLMVADSYAIPHYNAVAKYFEQYGTPCQVVVSKPPDLRSPENRDEIWAMVHDFATSRHAVGPESVQFFLNETEYYFNDELGIGMSDEAFYDLIDNFVNVYAFEKWSADIEWQRDDEIGADGVRKLRAFRFLIGLRDFSKTTQQQEAVGDLRAVADKYEKFNVTTFGIKWLFVDQFDLVLPNTIQNIVIALICMCIIALFLIPQPVCAFWVALAIVSIDVGVIGYMTLWGVNLDTISMITLIMSIGFSVDFSAHITHGYVISGEDNPVDRVRMALGALGWPIVQGAVSTVLGVSVLSNVNAYMVVTFFKTVFLVIIIGMIHGLVFLPVLLSFFVRGCCVVGGEKKPPAILAKQSSIVAPHIPDIIDVSHSLNFLRFKSNCSHLQGKVKKVRSGIQVPQAKEDIHPYGRYGIFLPRMMSKDEKFVMGPDRNLVFGWVGAFMGQHQPPPHQQQMELQEQVQQQQQQQPQRDNVNTEQERPATIAEE